METLFEGFIESNYIVLSKNDARNRDPFGFGLKASDPRRSGSGVGFPAGAAARLTLVSVHHRLLELALIGHSQAFTQEAKRDREDPRRKFERDTNCNFGNKKRELAKRHV